MVWFRDLWVGRRPSARRRAALRDHAAPPLRGLVEPEPLLQRPRGARRRRLDQRRPVDRAAHRGLASRPGALPPSSPPTGAPSCPAPRPVLAPPLDPRRSSGPHPVDDFIDPTLRRMTPGWADSEVPRPPSGARRAHLPGPRRRSPSLATPGRSARLAELREEYRTVHADAMTSCTHHQARPGSRAGTRRKARPAARGEQLAEQDAARAAERGRAGISHAPRRAARSVVRRARAVRAGAPEPWCRTPRPDHRHRPQRHQHDLWAPFTISGLPRAGPHLGANASNPKGFFESRGRSRSTSAIDLSAGINHVRRPARPPSSGPRPRSPLISARPRWGPSSRAARSEPPTSWSSRTRARSGRKPCGARRPPRSAYEHLYISMPRHPAEVVGSRTTYYSQPPRTRPAPCVRDLQRRPLDQQLRGQRARDPRPAPRLRPLLRPPRPTGAPRAGRPRRRTSG